jgi:propionyl-CoA carboxylase beta chain
VICFARIQGVVVGIIANQSAVKAGTLDIDASDKAARFIRFCNVFNIPIVNLVDVPGFLPGVRRNAAASSGTGPRCSSPTPRPRCRRSR